MLIKNLLWIVPFLSFLAGYQFFTFIFSIDSVDVPSLIGQNLSIALRLLSKENLNARLLAEKPDADLPEGTVLTQIPEAGTKIKPRQQVFLVISKRPPLMRTPLFLGCDETQCSQKSKEMGIRLKIFKIASSYPSNRCIAQVPSADQELHNKTVIAYFPKAETAMVIFPDLTGQPISVVREFLREHNLNIEFFHVNGNKFDEVDGSAHVVDQKPRPGALINMDKLLLVRVYFDR